VFDVGDKVVYPHHGAGTVVSKDVKLVLAQLLGNRDTRLYDGSWSEWGADPATPKVLGPA